MPKTNKARLPADLIAELAELDPRSKLSRWTEEQDAVVLEFWGKKNQEQLAKWFKKKYGWGSRYSLRNRYKQLTEVD